jgi:hypothetical protein
MEEPITPTQLRKNVYRILDEVLETGRPVVIERKGRRLHIQPEAPRRDLSKLKPHPGLIIGDPEDLVEIDWLSEWNSDPL